MKWFTIVVIVALTKFGGIDSFSLNKLIRSNHEIFQLHAESSFTRRRSESLSDIRRRYDLNHGNNNNDGNGITLWKKKKKAMPVTNYNADSIMSYYDSRPWEVTWRLNILGLPLYWWYIQLLLDERLFKRSENEAIQRLRGTQLRNHLIRSRSVAFIKSGQALSLRPDVLRNKIWAEELGKLVDAVGTFPNSDAMRIMRQEYKDMLPRLQAVKDSSKSKPTDDKDLIMNLFEFYNDKTPSASASIGQVYKARVKPGPYLDAAVGTAAAQQWANKIVAIKIQRPDAAASASLDMYLLRKAAMWASKFRGGDLVAIADQFGQQLFGELDYVREADNCERFRDLYGSWDNVVVPRACRELTRQKVLVMEWVDGVKGPWQKEGYEMVQIGIRCSVDQLMHTGLFHADPHRGNLLKTDVGDLAFIDFGMMADVTEEERYGLIGLCIGLQNKDLPLITQNLLNLGFLKDTTQLDVLIPRLRKALLKSTGGTGKASDVNFARLQSELDDISRENVLQFNTPPFFTVIIRSLTILEGMALNVDPNFRLIRGAYPYVLKQLLSDEEGGGRTPVALRNLLVRLLTVDGKGERIEWARLRDFLQLAQSASKKYEPSSANRAPNSDDDKATISRQTIDLFFKFLTSKTGLFLKTPLVHELAQSIDTLASFNEKNLFRLSNGLIRPLLPGGNGPINEQRIQEIQSVFEMIRLSIVSSNDENDEDSRMKLMAFLDFMRQILDMWRDERMRAEMAPILNEVYSVCQNVAVEVLEIRGSRAMRKMFQLS